MDEEDLWAIYKYLKTVPVVKRAMGPPVASQGKALWQLRPRSKAFGALETGDSAHSLPFHGAGTWRAHMLSKRRKWIGVLVLAAWIGSGVAWLSTGRSGASDAPIALRVS